MSPSPAYRRRRHRKSIFSIYPVRRDTVVEGIRQHRSLLPYPLFFCEKHTPAFIDKSRHFVLEYRVETAYVPIAQYFVSGSGALGNDSYIFDTHGAFTYYTAVKYNLFNKS